MPKKGILSEIHEQIEKIVNQFNKKVIRDPECFYTTRYKGNYLYLDRNEYGNVAPICRLKYTGDMNNWEFAIYKYSRDHYDPDECFFPGEDHVDGTIEGAMKAGVEAYPY